MDSIWATLARLVSNADRIKVKIEHAYWSDIPSIIQSAQEDLARLEKLCMAAKTLGLPPSKKA